MKKGLSALAPLPTHTHAQADKIHRGQRKEGKRQRAERET